MAKKSLGQNFLVDARAVSRIVTAANADGRLVVEIGPGHGAITRGLLARAARMAVVEFDRDLAARLCEDASLDGLHVIEKDILQTPLGEVAESLGAGGPGELVVVGNLPYNISKPVVQKLIRERYWVGRAVLMFQKEVALRLTSGPGGRAYGPFGLLARKAFAIERLFDLRPGAFRPRPKVDSTVTRWSPILDESFDEVAEANLRHCLATCFASRRRTLRNNLRRVVAGDAVVDRLLDRAGLDGAARAEAIEAAGFDRLAPLLAQIQSAGVGD